MDFERLNADIKELDAQLTSAKDFIKAQMGAAAAVGLNGQTLATWKAAKASKRFNAGLFQQAMPDIYSQFVVETPGSRRFLVK
jgi:hypothetical protein